MRTTGFRLDPAHIKPGKDHYVRSNGKLVAILLASRYPTRVHLEAARQDYERGTGAAVEISYQRFSTASPAADRPSAGFPTDRDGQRAHHPGTLERSLTKGGAA